MKGVDVALVPALLALLAATATQAGDAPPTDPASTPAPAEREAATSAPADESLPPRARYNRGLAELAAEDHAAAADAFLAARDDAGPDPLLRYRAAFNLGYALAQGVDAETPPAEAIETLRQSAAWFGDAVRLAPPEDEDARINLELVSRRILQLADQLNAGARLEARLDRLIDDQRNLRDQLRGLLADIGAAGAETEPLGFKSEFEGLASRERTLLAELGDCVDLATEERLFIEQLPAEERTPEQQGRAYRLAALTDFLERARQSLGDARRRLRRLEGERAHRRADAALGELKRAREQLLDPLAVLQAVLRDELELAAHTALRAAFETDPPADGQPAPDEPRTAAQRPPWLTRTHLRERQEVVGARTGGVLGQFDAVTAQADAAPADSAPGEDRMARAIAEATPFLEDALAAMRAAIDALGNDSTAAALPEQERAAAGLGEAIELFADAKGLIELAYAGQRRIEDLLAPGGEGGASSMSAAGALAPAERAEALFAQTSANQRRLGRLEGLLGEQPAAVAAGEDGAGEPDETAAKAAEERREQAEALRVRALTGLSTLAGHLAAVAEGGPPPEAARAAADDALQAIDALRRLYFSVVEHLQALRQEQADTHDQTATVQFEASTDASAAVVSQLAPVAERQGQHQQLGDALATALAQQADAARETAAAAAAVPPGGEASDSDAAERFATAAAELRQATGRMASAQAVLAEAAARAGAMSPELEPALDDQQAALDHLDAALLALAPPDGGQHQQNQGRGGDDGNDDAVPPQADAASEAMSQRQARRRLQAIRDREAERQRRRAGASERDPVEKDW